MKAGRWNAVGVVAGVTVLALSVASVNTAQAGIGQAKAQADRDLAEVKAYRLSMDGLRKIGLVYKALYEAAMSDPKLKQLVAKEAELEKIEEQLAEKEEWTDAETQKVEALRAEIEKLEESKDNSADLGDAKTISDMARQIEATPMYATAVRRAGMSSREFATAQLALFQSMMAYGFMKSGHVKELPANAEISKENVDFLRTHEKEIEALTAEWKQFGMGKN